MKDSGVEWLGMVPEHWEMNRLGYCSNLIVPMRDKPELLDGSIPWVRIEDFSGRYLKKSKTNQGVSIETVTKMNLKIFPKGTVLCSCSCTMGATAIASTPLVSNQTFIGIVPKSNLKSEYVYWLMQVSKGHLTKIATGAIQQYLSRGDFSRLRISVPPLPEQVAIARYLDYVDSRVRRLTEAKRKLIGLLTEYKQAIIHRAVTRGLDPNVPLKDSGIEWLGMIPQHWEVQRLKHWLKVNEEVLPETTDPNYEFDYIDIGLVEIGKLTTEPKRMKFANAPSRARRVVRKGDTIVSTVRTYLKAVWYAEEPTNNLIASTGFAVLRPSSGTFPKFVSYMVQSDAFTNQVTADSVGIAYPAITETKFGTFLICVPPISEQVAIVEYLDRATAEIDIAVARAERQIELLNEYRTRLIADVVTGKLDVRDATLTTENPDTSTSPLAPLSNPSHHGT